MTISFQNFDIEQPDALIGYLRDAQRIGPAETPLVRVLPGGVSCRTVLVRRDAGESWVVKQALAKLRVKAEWLSNPQRIHREALGLRWLGALAPPQAITPLVFEDSDQHLIAMAAVPEPHDNWKQLLLAGTIAGDHVHQFARLLGSIHRQAWLRAAELKPIFDDATYFESLRLEPYYQYSARQLPEQAGAFLAELVATTRTRRLTLVHGDFSPKNVLIHHGPLVLLDHEVIHWGDPAFVDSRGRPTVQATCLLADGASATVSVPSGRSTGQAEALELRDGDPRRYRGLGCRNAVASIEGAIRNATRNHEFADQAGLDRALIELDGTPNKSALGANAILAVSLAFARACAVARGVPLYQHFADIAVRNGCAIPSAILEPGANQAAQPAHGRLCLPRPTINLFSGGKHAGGQMPIQDVLIVPIAAPTIDEALATTFEVYQCAAELCFEKYGMRPLKADEGGLAPPFASAEAAFGDAVAAIEKAGFQPGRDVALAVDVASSHFFDGGRYQIDGGTLSSPAMIDKLDGWINQFPIISLEDGFAEDDWSHWPRLRQRVADRALVLGDDFLCTNPARIQRAIDAGAANALLLKVNQIGTVTEAAHALRLARQAGWHVTVSARSGETEDNWLADLAVGWAGNHIKIGSITQSERLTKYNRLLEIERETQLRFA